MKRFLVLLLASVMMSSVIAVEGYDGFRFLKRVRGLKLSDSKVVEVSLDEKSQNLLVCYRERKVVYVSIIKLGSWDKVNDYRVDDNVSLFASYFDLKGEELYLNTDIYKLLYKRINVVSGVIDTLECVETPRGCNSIDDKMPEIEVRSNDGYFIYVRDKEHPNDVLVYMDNIQFDNVRKEMEEALQREVYIREVKEKLETDARKEQLAGVDPITVAEKVVEQPRIKKEDIQITQEDILTLMTTGRFEKAGMVMTLSPGLKVKIDNSNVSTLDEPAESYYAGDIIKLESIGFEQGKSTLSESSYTELDKLVALLTSKPTLEVQINGHTNNKGTNNMEISESRAKAVVEYVQTKGIDETRLRYRGFGASQPIATNDTDGGLAKNRRVEIEIIKQ